MRLRSSLSFLAFAACLAIASAQAQVSQTIAVGPYGDHAGTDAPFRLSGASTAGDNLIFTSLTSSICTAGPTYYTPGGGGGVQYSAYYNSSDITLTGTGGTCTIALDAAGGNGVNPAPRVTATFDSIVDNPALITSPASATFTTGVPVSFTFTTSATYTPTYTLTHLSSLNFGLVFDATTATISGTTYVPGGSPFTFSVFKNGILAATQTFVLNVTGPYLGDYITFGAIAPSYATSDPPFDVRAYALSNLPITFSSLTPSICTVGPTSYTTMSIYYNYATVTLTGTVGVCRVAANTPGDDSHKPGHDVISTDVGTGFLLTVNHAGANLTGNLVGGSGAIASVTPSGAIDCSVGSSICSAMFAVGASVTLSATPAPASAVLPASAFVGWSGGGCSGTGNCTVAMDAAKSVTAIWGIAPRIASANHATFVVNAAGTFSVIASGAGDPTLSLNGVLPAGVSFTPSTGVLAGTPAPGTVGPYPLTITAANEALPNASQSFTLTVSKADQAITFTNPGPQTLTATPIPLTVSVTSGLPLALASATPLVCSISGTNVLLLSAGTCTITAGQLGNADFNAALFASRTFQVSAPQQFALSVTKSGAGTGSVGSSPAGINCGATCLFSFTTGTPVTLTATPTGGSTFVGWSGDCTGTGTCQLTMGAAKSVTATFDPASTSQSADVAIAQAANPSPAGAGKDVIFTLTATNSGPAAATSLTIVDLIPVGSSFVWASPGCTSTIEEVTCNVGALASGASIARKVVLRPAVAGSMVNTARVSATNSDPHSTNNVNTLLVTVNTTPPGTPIQRYRLYSDVTKEHHFTTDQNEYNVLGTYIGTWVQEGTVGKILNNPGPFGGVESIPYYRLYDNYTRWHHWTTDANEYYTLGFVYSTWNMEGVDGYILPSNPPGTTQLYRLNYPALGSLHHWTIDANEHNTLITSFGWVGEAGAGFVVQ